jgi:hypothetical protein
MKSEKVKGKNKKSALGDKLLASMGVGKVT